MNIKCHGVINNAILRETQSNVNHHNAYNILYGNISD